MKIFPIVVKKITQVVGGGGTATATWGETEQLSDPTVSVVKVGADTEQVSEQFNSVFLTISEVQNESDLVGETLSAIFPETENESDVSKIVGLIYPDQGDTWLDQASAGTSHGTDTTILAKGASTAPGSDERRAYMYFDLTKFQHLLGDSSASNALTLNFFASTSNGLTATTLTVTFRSGATQPFVEGTATWTGQSASLASYGTLRNTSTKSIATGAAAAYSIGLNATIATNAISDGFLLVTCTTAGGAVPDTVTINSKENASNKPTVTLNLTSG